MRNKPLLTMLSTAALTAATALSVPMSSTIAAPRGAVEARKFTSDAYIVQLADAPVVAYDGSIKGYAATRPAKGQKIDPTSPQVVNYKAYLDSKHDAAVASVGGKEGRTGPLVIATALIVRLARRGSGCRRLRSSRAHAGGRHRPARSGEE